MAASEASEHHQDALRGALEASEAREADLAWQLAECEVEASNLRDQLAHAQQLLTQAGALPAEWPVPSAQFNSSAQVVLGLPQVDASYRQQLMRIHNGLSGRENSEEDEGEEGATPALTGIARSFLPPARSRWVNARARLVDIACFQRETMRLQTTFFAWLNILRKKMRKSVMSGERKMRLLTSLEEQRQRTLTALHAAHLENRWHRQYLGGLQRHKQILLLWCGRTLRRCWLAWAAHIVRVRIEREVTDELRQLAYALRVASLSRHAALARAIAGDETLERRARERRAGSPLGFGRVAAASAAASADVRHQRNGGPLSPSRLSDRLSMSHDDELDDELEELHRHPLDSYTIRRAWLGWTCHVATSRVAAEYDQATIAAILQGQNNYRSARVAVGLPAVPPAPPVSKRTPPASPTSLTPGTATPSRSVGRVGAANGALATGGEAESESEGDEFLDAADASSEGGASPGGNPLQALHPIMNWLSRPQAWFEPAEAPLTDAERSVEDALHAASEGVGAVLRARTLALCFSSWRVFLATECFLREEEAEKSALVISLWRAATAGLLDARASAQSSLQANKLAGVAGMLGLHSDDDDSDDDYER